jgi:hypothetical protein
MRNNGKNSKSVARIRGDHKREGPRVGGRLQTVEQSREKIHPFGEESARREDERHGPIPAQGDSLGCVLRRSFGRGDVDANGALRKNQRIVAEKVP